MCDTSVSLEASRSCDCNPEVTACHYYSIYGCVSRLVKFGLGEGGLESSIGTLGLRAVKVNSDQESRFHLTSVDCSSEATSMRHCVCVPH